ncbi:hypothetical protein [Aquimarina sp. 2201CG14-23]|uniref:hypothetical protein n=1 Tax=Aquimarina mycalae TaxID=3040073 RepID=UPI002477E56C|nr:hypothetical protein [Aquimarina sp. 2201CG14-23]MDH7445118.1 hypothetical protein [Aquimarina sp. 2201CG14-23]
MSKISMVFLILILVTSSLNAQEEPPNKTFRFKAFSVGAGLYRADYREKNPNDSFEGDQTGISGFVGISFYLKKHILSAQALGGFQPNLIFAEKINNESFYSFNLLYGRELEVKKWFKIEGHLGLGYYVQERRISGLLQKEVELGVPANLKFSFYIRKYIGLGFAPQVIFNSLNNTYTGNIFFHVKLP